MQPECPSMQVLGPTIWIVRADSLNSVLNNYSVLQELWEESVKVTKESQIIARIIGIASQIATFDFYSGVHIGEMILRHTYIKHISAAEEKYFASLVKTTLQFMCSDASIAKYLMSRHINSTLVSQYC